MGKNIDQVFIANPASSMASTDLYYLGRSPYGATNDMAITWANVLASINSSLGAAQNVIYVNAQTGNDTTGNGSAINPYATISHATAAITTNTTNNRFVLFLQGIFSEAAITVKPWVSWFSPVDVATRVSVTGAGNNVTLDAGWAGTTNATVGIWNVIFPSPTKINFNLNGVSGSGSAIYFNNCTMISTTTAQGRVAGTDGINFLSTSLDGNVSVTDMSAASYTTSYGANVSFTSTSAASPIFWTSGEDQFYGPVTISETSGQSCILQATNGSMQGSVTVTGAVASYQYDCTTYPGGNFTFATGGQAFPLLRTGLNLVPVQQQSGATYTTLPSDHVINITRAGAVAVTLGSGAVAGQWYRIKDISGAAATNNITLTPAAGTIDGAANYKINTNYGAVDVVFDGANWWIY